MQHRLWNAARPDYRFSPDGKWLAYTRLERNWNRVVLKEACSNRDPMISPAMAPSIVGIP